MRRILTAPVDLLYNGGIGTYVKATGETHAQVGDRANDRVRVDGRELRARVVGEGGNLGFTQKGRLEYWATGGLVNTDAVDNSGGVDTSDHEVNIKILLDALVRKGVVQRPRRAQPDPGRDDGGGRRPRARRQLGPGARAEPRRAAQRRSATRSSWRSWTRWSPPSLRTGARGGLLSRSDESVPSREELLASPQRERGLPRPLLCVLLGYSKMRAFQQLLDTDFPDGALGRPFLDAYFPRLLRERFAEHFQDHVLRREIVATGAVNYLVNRGGITLLPRLSGVGGRGIGEAVAAWIAARSRDGRRGAAARRARGLRPRSSRPRSSRSRTELLAAALERLAGGSVGAS